jgi:hypothetical protein
MKNISDTLKRVYIFYIDGFKGMVLGKKLWKIILIKLFIKSYRYIISITSFLWGSLSCVPFLKQFMFAQETESGGTLQNSG